MASSLLSHFAPSLPLVMSRVAEKLKTFSARVPHADASQAADSSQDAGGEQFRQVAFTLSVIALSAKLARADGKVVMEEFLAFRELFPMQDHLSSRIRDMFVAACDDATSFEHHARQIALLFPGRERLLSELLDRLFKIAVADGVINLRERDYLFKVSNILGVSKFQFSRMISQYSHPVTADPYKVLGISPKTTNEELKKAYRRLIRENHPDGLQAYGVAEDLVKLAQKKVVMINEAYDVIQRKRGLKKSTE